MWPCCCGPEAEGLSLQVHGPCPWVQTPSQHSGQLHSECGVWDLVHRALERKGVRGS